MDRKALAAMSGPDFANLLERVQAEVQHSLSYLYPDVVDDSEQSRDAAAHGSAACSRKR